MTQLNPVGRAPRKPSNPSGPAVGRAAPPRPALRVVAPATAPTADPAARVRALFEDVLPRLISQRAELFNQFRGSLSVFVEGAGAWCVRFGDHQRADAIGRDARFDTDGVVVFSLPAFVRLLDGLPGVAPTVALGDTTLVARLGQLMLEPTRGALGVRLSTPTSPRR